MGNFFGNWLKKKFLRTTEAPGTKKYRLAVGSLEAWVSIIGNIILFGVKFTIGVLIGSISIVADAFHTLSDVLSSLVVLLGFKFSSKGPDEEHPYGHGRLEYISTLVISILLILTGLEFVKSSVDRFIHPISVGGGWWVVVIMILSAVLKEWMARFALALGEEIESSTLKADAWHHRSDAIAAFLVAVGNMAAVRELHWVDPLLGLGVSGLIIYTGWELAHSSGSRLIGTSPPAEVVELICNHAKSVPAVEEVHQVQVHDYGYHKVLTAHKAADEVERRLAGLLQAEVVVHVDPRTRSERE